MGLTRMLAVASDTALLYRNGPLETRKSLINAVTGSVISSVEFMGLWHEGN